MIGKQDKKLKSHQLNNKSSFEVLRLWLITGSYFLMQYNCKTKSCDHL